MTGIEIDEIKEVEMWRCCPQYEQPLSYNEWLALFAETSSSLLSSVFNNIKHKKNYKAYLVDIKKYNDSVDEFFSVEREYNADKTMYKVAIFDSVETVPVVLGNIEDVLIVEESEDY